jgi:hypothetical protein
MDQGSVLVHSTKTEWKLGVMYYNQKLSLLNCYLFRIII